MSSNYFKDWPSPNSGYIQDLNWGSKVAIDYLRKLKQTKKLINPCVLFDVDETLVFGDPDESIGVREMELGERGGQPIFILPPNPQIVQIAKVAKSLGIKVIVLTARPMISKLATITNLDMFGIPYDKVFMNDKDEDPEFKVRLRRRIAAQNSLLLTVGDQPTDVLLPGKSGILKLPDPTSKCCYFLPGLY
jgi:hypothetical protein